MFPDLPSPVMVNVPAPEAAVAAASCDFLAHNVIAFHGELDLSASFDIAVRRVVGLVGFLTFRRRRQSWPIRWPPRPPHRPPFSSSPRSSELSRFASSRERLGQAWLHSTRESFPSPSASPSFISKLGRTAGGIQFARAERVVLVAIQTAECLFELRPFGTRAAPSPLGSREPIPAGSALLLVCAGSALDELAAAGLLRRRSCVARNSSRVRLSPGL